MTSSLPFGSTSVHLVVQAEEDVFDVPGEDRGMLAEIAAGLEADQKKNLWTSPTNLDVSQYKDWLSSVDHVRSNKFSSTSLPQARLFLLDCFRYSIQVQHHIHGVLKKVFVLPCSDFELIPDPYPEIHNHILLFLCCDSACVPEVHRIVFHSLVSVLRAFLLSLKGRWKLVRRHAKTCFHVPKRRDDMVYQEIRNVMKHLKTFSRILNDKSNVDFHKHNKSIDQVVETSKTLFFVDDRVEEIRHACGELGSLMKKHRSPKNQLCFELKMTQITQLLLTMAMELKQNYLKNQMFLFQGFEYPKMIDCFPKLFQHVHQGKSRFQCFSLISHVILLLIDHDLSQQQIILTAWSNPPTAITQ